MPGTHITKNYFAHGGNELVIGGKLTILEGATVDGLAGGSTAKMAYVADSEATTVVNLKNDFNALLAAMRAGGVMEEAAANTNTETTEPDPETPAEGTEDGGT